MSRTPAPLPTIRLRFLRSLIATSLLITLIAVLGIAAADALYLRQMTITNLSHYAEAISSVAKTNIKDAAELNRHLKDFSHQPGLAKTCIYDKSNLLTAYWLSPAANGQCPGLVTAEATDVRLLEVKITKQIGGKTDFEGMVYLEGHLSEFRELLFRMGATLMVLLLVATLICLGVSHLASRRISEPLQVLYEQVECLMRHDKNQCALPPRAQTMETAMLFHAITELRASLQATMVPTTDIENIHQWYRGVIFGLIAMLRRRLSENSPLLPAVGDYALLLRLEGGTSMPKPAIFDLSHVCDRAFATAKRIQPPAPEVYPTLSIKPGTPNFWMGYEELVESFFRNLLVISFSQTGRGIVRLRLEASIHPQTQQKILAFTLEDGSNSAGTGLFHANLKRAADIMNATSKPLDISWALITRLPKVLCGELNSVARTGGNMLIGHMQINDVLPGNETQSAKPNININAAPLVLLVEDDRMNLIMQRNLLEQSGWRVFTVRSASEALEWAAFLPLSVIVLDTMLPDMQGHELAQKLYAMMHSNAMPEVPIWALTASDTEEDRSAWHKAGVSTILIKPLTRETLVSLTTQLSPSDPFFFLKHDIEEHDFSMRIMERMPELTRELARQIRALTHALSHHAPSIETAEAAHAVKSAALTLGYGRLAACMDALEHALRNGAQTSEREDVAEIERLLSAAAPLLAA